MRFGVVGCAALALACQSVDARDWPRAGGFDIGEADEACFLTSEFEGEGDTELIVGLNLDGSTLVIVENYNWSAKKDEEYKDISFHLSGGNYGGGTAHGTEHSGRHGFSIGAPGKFLQDFAGSSYFHVYKGDQVIDRLDLKGSGAAVAMVRRCVAAMRAVKDAEERKRRPFADIPKDPFAKPEQ